MRIYLVEGVNLSETLHIRSSECFVRGKKGRCLGVVWVASFFVVLADVQLRLKTEADGGPKDDYGEKKKITIVLKGGREREGSAGESIYELPAAMSVSYEWQLCIRIVAL